MILACGDQESKFFGFRSLNLLGFFWILQALAWIFWFCICFFWFPVVEKILEDGCCDLMVVKKFRVKLLQSILNGSLVNQKAVMRGLLWTVVMCCIPSFCIDSSCLANLSSVERVMFQASIVTIGVFLEVFVSGLDWELIILNYLVWLLLKKASSEAFWFLDIFWFICWGRNLWLKPCFYGSLPGIELVWN